MNLYSELLELLPKEPVRLRSVMVGVHWTLVCSRNCGLASTLVNCGPHGHTHMRDVGSLLEKSAQELAGWMVSDNLLEASVGMAAFNSLIDVDTSKLKEVNASEVLKRECPGKNLAVIGHFPFISKLRDLAANLWVIEKDPHGDDFPEEAAQDCVPRADIVAITGTAFINHTMENLLSLCRPGALVMILGPSTPMAPLLFDHGVTYLSGSRVIDESAARLTIAQGAGFPQVQGVQVVTMVKDA